MERECILNGRRDVGVGGCVLEMKMYLWAAACMDGPTREDKEAVAGYV